MNIPPGMELERTTTTVERARPSGSEPWLRAAESRTLRQAVANLRLLVVGAASLGLIVIIVTVVVRVVRWVG